MLAIQKNKKERKKENEWAKLHAEKNLQRNLFDS